jgi:hypothetical protein
VFTIPMAGSIGTRRDLPCVGSETKRGKQARVDKDHLLGDLPFGDRLAANGEDAESTPERAKGVQLVCRKYAEGIHGEIGIARTLNRADYRNRGKRASIPFS